MVWNEQWKTPSFVSGPLLKGEDAPEELVYRYLDQEKNTFQLGGQARERLSLIGKQTDELGHTVMRFEQRYHGIPVYGAVLVAHVNDGELSSLSGTLIPNLDKRTLKTEAAISIQQAEMIAKQDVADAVTKERPAAEEGKPTRLVIYPDRGDPAPRL